MSSLTVHLRESGSHGRLAFHPGCPICREQRLLGTLSDGPVVSPKLKAGLAAGVLATSALGWVPVTAFASEPASEHEGRAAPEDPGAPGDPLHSPDFDPGGPDTELPVPIGAEEPDAEPEAPGSLEPEPLTDPGVAPAPETGIADPPEPVTEPPPALAPEPSPPGAGLPVAEPPAASEPPAAEAPSRPEEETRPDRETEEPSRRSVDERRTAAQPAPLGEAPPTATPPAVVATEEADSLPGPGKARASESPRAKPGDTAHVVRDGESLWSIARGLLGPDASVAEVARKVNRLWELNRERIGTGDPNLILPGTQLRLR